MMEQIGEFLLSIGANWLASLRAMAQIVSFLAYIGVQVFLFGFRGGWISCRGDVIGM
jgi:hypothetical protein